MLGKFIFNKIYVLRRFDVWSINNNVSTRISKLIYNHDPIWLLNCMGSRQWNTLCKVWSRDSQSDIQKKENMASHAECFVFVTKGKKWEGEKCYKVYIKVQKATRWTIKTWFFFVRCHNFLFMNVWLAISTPYFVQCVSLATSHAIE